MKIDDSWLGLTSPNFKPYAGMDPDKRIMLLGADVFSPDPCIPKHVIDAVKQALDNGRTHYALDNGYAVPELKSALTDKLKSFNKMEIDSECELMVIPSSAFGLYAGIRICIRPNRGDEVINFDPGFSENFNDVFQMGAVNARVRLYKEDGFQIRYDELIRAINQNTRCIVVTNPNNPTATVFNRKSLEAVAQAAREYDLGVVVDQSFERNIYDNIEYINFANLPGMKERTITVFGTSKDLGLTGFRVGYMTAPKMVMDILKTAEFNYVGPTNTFAQYGVAAAYRDPSYVDGWMEEFRYRREYGYSALNGIPGVECAMPEGGYYFWADVHRLGDSEEIRDFLISDADVGVSPGNWFGVYGEGYLRIMFGAVKDRERYKEAMRRIVASLSKLPVKLG